jgi:hypothetical protein
MISQLDPMIAACKHPYYQEKQVTSSLLREKSLFESLSLKLVG